MRLFQKKKRDCGISWWKISMVFFWCCLRTSQSQKDMKRFKYNSNKKHQLFITMKLRRRTANCKKSKWNCPVKLFLIFRLTIIIIPIWTLPKSWAHLKPVLLLKWTRPLTPNYRNRTPNRIFQTFQISPTHWKLKRQGERIIQSRRMHARV